MCHSVMNEKYIEHFRKRGFELERAIGNGLSGKTFIAVQKSLDRRVAVKFFDSALSKNNADLRKRFERESKLLAELQHPSIPYVITNGNVQCDSDKIPYIVMQYIAGETLEEYIKKYSPVEFEKVKSIAYQILDALIFIHEKGIIHRDIKPSNIMIHQSGHCFLIDFSIGFKQEPEPGMTRATRTGDHLGSYLYMSPEQSTNMKDVDNRSDIYSFSKVLCELLTGKPDIGSVNSNNLRHGDLLRTIISKGLSHSPDDRYLSAAEFKRELSQVTNSIVSYRDEPARAICVNTKCPSANWSPNGYYRGPNVIEESSDAYCTSCGTGLTYQCASCGAAIENTPFCGGCGTRQFVVPECKRCGSLLTKDDMDKDTEKVGCEKCRRKESQQKTTPNDFDDIPF